MRELLQNTVYWNGQARIALITGSTVELEGRVFDVVQACYLEPGDTADRLAMRPEFVERDEE